MEYERVRQYLLRVNPGELHHAAWVVDMLQNLEGDDLGEIFGLMGYGDGYGDEAEHELEEFEVDMADFKYDVHAGQSADFQE
eukprot:15632615-Heterocapsa_arctica.AAC.1